MDVCNNGKALPADWDRTILPKLIPKEEDLLKIRKPKDFIDLGKIRELLELLHRVNRQDPDQLIKFKEADGKFPFSAVQGPPTAKGWGKNELEGTDPRIFYQTPKIPVSSPNAEYRFYYAGKKGCANSFYLQFFAFVFQTIITTMMILK